MSEIRDDEKEIVLSHNYDSIQELDNPLPGWWLFTFFITVVFSFIYYIHFEIGGGESTDQELARSMAEIQKRFQSAPQDLNIDYAALLVDSNALASGKKNYDTKCAACHGNQLEGLIGPNLVDAYWIHGDGGYEGIALSINKGIVEKGMPPWESVLKPMEVAEVVAYIKSLKGTNPANAKAPQGDKKEL